MESKNMLIESIKLFKLKNKIEDQDQIKKVYHQLSFKYHPDKSTGSDLLQSILNNAYNTLKACSLFNLNMFIKSIFPDTYDIPNTYDIPIDDSNKPLDDSKPLDNDDNKPLEDNNPLDTIAEIITRLKNTPLKIQIIGTWLWVSGETIDYKELLKSLKLRYTPKKKQWYFTTTKKHFRKKYQSKYKSMDALRNKWGYKDIEDSSALLSA